MRNNRQLLTFVFIVALATLGFAACSRDTGVEASREMDRPAGAADPSVVSPAEQDFMMKVTQANVGEIMMARQAMRKSQNKDVVDYANMIEKDHTMTLEQLTSLMAEKNVVQSKAPAPEAAQEMDRMNDLSGTDFDREYANMMVEKHQKAVDMFREQSENAINPDVKDYASDTLPTLEMHLEKAHSLQSKLFNGNAR
jgi:putative membrane protein